MPVTFTREDSRLSSGLTAITTSIQHGMQDLCFWLQTEVLKYEALSIDACATVSWQERCILDIHHCCDSVPTLVSERFVCNSERSSANPLVVSLCMMASLRACTENC